jgi:hypothetical protein
MEILIAGISHSKNCAGGNPSFEFLVRIGGADIEKRVAGFGGEDLGDTSFNRVVFALSSALSVLASQQLELVLLTLPVLTPIRLLVAIARTIWLTFTKILKQEAATARRAITRLRA